MNKISTGKSYQLTLTGEEFKNLLLKFLEAFKQDTVIQNKLNNIVGREVTSSDIDQMIEDVNKLEVESFKLIVETTDGILTGIVIQIDNNIVSLRKQVTGEQLSYQGEIQTIQDETNIKLGITSQFNGLQSLNTIDENHNINIEISAENQVMAYNYNILNKIQFNDTISIEGFNSENSIVLNDYDETTLENYIDKVGERIIQVNQNHIEKLDQKNMIKKLISETTINFFNPDFLNSAFDIISDISKHISMYDFWCTKDINAIECLEKTLGGKS